MRHKHFLPLTFAMLLSTVLSLLPALHPAAAVEVIVKGPYYGGPPTVLEAGVPPPDVRFPLVCYLLQRQDCIPGSPGCAPLAYAGYLVLSKDFTLAYFPKIHTATIERSLLSYNHEHTYRRAHGFGGLEGFDELAGVYYSQLSSHNMVGAPEKSWNAFLIFLADLVKYHRVADTLAVTYGVEPTSNYTPEFEAKQEGTYPNGSKKYAYMLSNPLPGMRIISYCDEFKPNFAFDRCPRDGEQPAPQ